MKISPSEIDFIQKVVNIANIVNIEKIIFEPGMVRAIDEERTVVLYTTENVPELSFGSLGLTRTDAFSSRYEIVKTQDNFSIESVMHPSGEWATGLKLSGKDTKIDFRCGNPSTIEAPKIIHDVMKTAIKLDGETVVMLQKGIAAMGAQVVTIINNDDVSFEFVDVGGDVFSHTFANKATSVTDSDVQKFVKKYPAKTLLALMKQTPDGVIKIGEKGILCVNVDGLDIFVLPRV